MKNELYIPIKGGNWLYFKTNKTTANEAFVEYDNLIKRLEINDDNVEYEYDKIELRNAETQEVISKISNKENK